MSLSLTTIEKKSAQNLVFWCFFVHSKTWLWTLNQETFTHIPSDFYKVPEWYLWHKSSLNRRPWQLWTEVHFFAMSTSYNTCEQVSSPETITQVKYRSKTTGINSCFGLPFCWMKQECNLTCIHTIQGGKRRTVGKRKVLLL